MPSASNSDKEKEGIVKNSFHGSKGWIVTVNGREVKRT